MPSPVELLQEASKYAQTLTEIRRDLHQIPEFGLNLPKTQQRILDSIHGLGDIHLGKDLNSIGLVIKGGKPGPTILLRADMDALSVKEETGLAYASTNGFMHACGHDLHMAAGIGAAHLLATHKALLCLVLGILWILRTVFFTSLSFLNFGSAGSLLAGSSASFTLSS